MESCLASYLSGTYPTGEPLEVDPVAAEAPVTPAPSAETGSLKAPIPTNPAAAPLAIYKGTLRFFDTASEQLLWEGSVQVKVPAQLRTGIQTKVIAYETSKAVEKSGLLPAKK
jgi:hypothetical protein